MEENISGDVGNKSEISQLDRQSFLSSVLALIREGGFSGIEVASIKDGKEELRIYGNKAELENIRKFLYQRSDPNSVPAKAKAQPGQKKKKATDFIHQTEDGRSYLAYDYADIWQLLEYVFFANQVKPEGYGSFYRLSYFCSHLNNLTMLHGVIQSLYETSEKIIETYRNSKLNFIVFSDNSFGLKAFHDSQLLHSELEKLLKATDWANTFLGQFEWVRSFVVWWRCWNFDDQQKTTLNQLLTQTTVLNNEWAKLKSDIKNYNITTQDDASINLSDTQNKGKNTIPSSPTKVSQSQNKRKQATSGKFFTDTSKNAKPKLTLSSPNSNAPLETLLQVIKNGDALVKTVEDFDFFRRSIADPTSTNVRGSRLNLEATRSNLSKKEKLEIKEGKETWVQDKKDRNSNPTDAKSTSMSLINTNGQGKLFDGTANGAGGSGSYPYVVICSGQDFTDINNKRRKGCRPAKFAYATSDYFTRQRWWRKGPKGEIAQFGIDRWKQVGLKTFHELKNYVNNTPLEQQTHNEAYVHPNQEAFLGLGFRGPSCFNYDLELRVQLICERLLFEEALNVQNLPIVVLNRKNDDPAPYTWDEQRKDVIQYCRDKRIDVNDKKSIFLGVGEGIIPQKLFSSFNISGDELKPNNTPKI